VGVVAGGSGGGRMGDPTGQRGRTARTGARDGAAGRAGSEPGKRGLEEIATGLVLGIEGISGGDAGVDRTEARQPALWGGVEGIRGTEGAAVARRDVAQSGLERSGVAAQTQGRCEESADGGAAACGDDDDLAVDCAAAGDGPLADGTQCNPADRLSKAVNSERKHTPLVISDPFAEKEQDDILKALLSPVKEFRAQFPFRAR